jgi:cytochrome c553
MHSSSMSKCYSLLAVTVTTALLLSTSVWAAGDAARGRARAQMCEGCHGIADYRTAYPQTYPVPKIGEQEAAYIVKALQDYKTGARKHPSMRGIAATLSDQDMADLAAYYAGEPRK